jgi:putative FmdB family regulatory protein
MPLFEFQCLECGARFEKLVRTAGAGPEVTCPKCGGGELLVAAIPVAKLVAAAEYCFRGSFPQPRRSNIECRLRRRATWDQVRANLSSISLRRSLRNEKLSAENCSMWSR